MISRTGISRKVVTGFAFSFALLVSGCGSQNTQIRHAYQAAFPGGHEVCFGIRFLNGLPDENGTVYYPSNGITSPLRHLFVFYVALSDAPVPNYVGYFLKLGLIQQHDVAATVDQETSHDGPQLISPAGIYYHNAVYHHTFSHFPVSIYTTALQDPRFAYDNRNPVLPIYDSAYTNSLNTPVFSSRVFDNPLPSPNVDYSIPLVAPYTISLVSGECYAETLDQITAATQIQGSNGDEIIQASVLLQPHAPDWMKTATFRSAANPDYGNTPSLDAPRRAILDFEMISGKLKYLEEEQGGL